MKKLNKPVAVKKTNKKTLSKNEREKIIQIVIQVCSELFPNPKTELEYSHEYELLFAVILSAQTTDVQVNKVTRKLFNQYPTLASYAQTTICKLEQVLSSINYYKSKARHIQATAKKLINIYQGDVPQELQELMSLPGVGRKTANVVQRELFDTGEGIAVDTHVIRLTNKLGLTKHKEPLKIEQDLLKLVTPEERGLISIYLILYGRRYWKANQKDSGSLSQELLNQGITHLS
jgi:endonuclease III